MTLNFADFFHRVQQGTDLKSQMDLASALGVNRSAITQAKNRNAIPLKWVLAISRQYGLTPDWLEFGRQPMKGLSSRTGSQAQQASAQQLVQRASGNQRTMQAENSMAVAVPQVSARLCAGGGSFDLEAVPVAHHYFPLSWLSRMGSPSAMVFMNVIGNSMEPGIMDGDMVLIDQAAISPSVKMVHAVGYEDTIFIKRVEKTVQRVSLLSDNPDYAPIHIQGDELDSFRILGKVIWLCRDC